MKKLISCIIISLLITPFVVNAQEWYLFSGFENAPNASQIETIQDARLKYCEQTYLEAMRRRPFTKEEFKTCRDVFIKRIKEEIEYKRRVMQERSIY